MTQMQLTTREAVEEAIYALSYRHGMAMLQETRDHLYSAAVLLCDLYGFKLAQFFGEAVEAVK